MAELDGRNESLVPKVRCAWVADDMGCYETECGRRVRLRRLEPEFEMFRWCPYCGVMIDAEVRDELPKDQRGEVGPDARPTTGRAGPFLVL